MMTAWTIPTRTKIALRRPAVHPTFAVPLADAFPVLSDAMATTIVETVSVKIPNTII